MGPPIAKFCNTLMFGTEADPMPTTMRLEIGVGNDLESSILSASVALS